MPVVRSSLSRPATSVVSSPVLPTPPAQVTPTPHRAAGRHSGARDLFAPTLTGEQLAVRDSQARCLQVCAYAGTGKTATLVERANANPTQRILYVAFNKSIADEARRKFPGNVTCQTSHALAFRQFGAAYRAKLGTPGVRSVMAAVGVRSPRYASAVLACLNGWFASADREIHERHIPLHVVVRRPGVDAPMSAPHYEEVVHGAKVLWQRMQDKENQAVVMAHDGYFKLWSLSSPRLGYDAIYFDEAQDANPALTAVLAAQKHAGLTMVGDPFQCVAKGTRILTPNGWSAVENLNVGDQVMAGAGAGQLVPSAVTDVFRSQAKDGLVRITTRGGRIIRSTPDHTHFAGFDSSGANRLGWCVYLMRKYSLGWRIGIASDHDHPTRGPIRGFMQRRQQESADEVWILKSGMTEKEAALTETVWSLRFGIPTAVFRDRGGFGYGQEFIAALFAAVPSEQGALRLLEFLGFESSSPHYRPKAQFSARRNFTITMGCGFKNLHRYAISGSDAGDAALLAAAGIKTRAAKKAHGWRVEGCSSSLGWIHELAAKVSSILPNLNKIELAAFGPKGSGSLPLTPAANCLPGMRIFVYDEHTNRVVSDFVESAQRETYDGEVFDLNVARFHNFVADGVVTHNSLYAFRGATNAMERSHYDQRLHLSQSFRFGPAVAEVASYILKLRGATLPLRGLTSIPSKVGEIPRDGSYTRIGRTNSSIVAAAVEETARGRSLFFVGGIAGYPFGDLLDVYQLWAGQKESIKNPDIQGFDDYSEYQETAEQAEDRAAIRLIKLVAQFGHQVPQLVERVQSQTTTDPRAANVTFATSHKAKGLEWPRVIIEDDFPAVLDNAGALLPHYAETNEGKQELNMLYVAATRAVNVLDLTTSASLREIVAAASRRSSSVGEEDCASATH